LVSAETVGKDGAGDYAEDDAVGEFLQYNGVIRLDLCVELNALFGDHGLHFRDQSGQALAVEAGLDEAALR